MQLQNIYIETCSDDECSYSGFRFIAQDSTELMRFPDNDALTHFVVFVTMFLILGSKKKCFNFS